MPSEQDTRQSLSPKEGRELNRLRRSLAISMVIAFTIPAVAIVFLSVMVWRLSVQLTEVQVLTDVSNIEMRYRPLNNYGYAITAYKDLIQRTKHPLAYARLAELAVAVGDLELARQSIQQVNSGDLPWYLNSTLSYLSLVEKKEREAIEFGEKAIEENPCDVQALNNVAWIYATTDDEQIRDLEKAEEYALRAVIECSKGKNIQFLDTLAEVYWRAEKKDLAVEKIQDAINVHGETSRYLQRRFDEIRANGSEKLR